MSTTTTLSDYLVWAGMSKTQAQIFVYLYQYGPKPASAVARTIGGERTNTYKLIETMIRQWYIAPTTIRGVKQFFVADKHVLRHHIEHEKSQITTKEQFLPHIEQWLAQLDQERISPLPVMRFFQGGNEIKSMIHDMTTQITSQNLKMIRLFATNTLESQVGSIWFGEYGNELIEFVDSQKIAVETHIVNGIMLLEQMIQSYDTRILSDLPAWQSSLMIVLIWSISYIMIFKHQPAWIKIESPELSQVLGFFLKTTR